jgi:diaminohydroxyphosphoribosylaminopyrimidine deaminase / 5-amino-6-(5-phosphoribosylamino)uracil reductase
MANNFNSELDRQRMLRALELAARGMGLASPNPMVGCVILDASGTLAGEGWHEYDRRDHAEVVALAEAGERARGGTAYVTLEPCNHTGRTGPCSLALIAAGVARVVMATTDPNPLVAGGGVARLRGAGIAVEVGLCEGEARRGNEGFAKWIVTRRPFVLMKVAMTQDGFIAPGVARRDAGRPYWVTGAEARAAVQRLRWAADAVLTGVDTALADDPLLTDRSGNRRRRPLLRVVLDSRLRLPLESRLVKTAREDVVVFTVSDDVDRRRALEARGVRVEKAAARDGGVDLDAVLERLGAEGVLTLLTETGTRLNSALMQAGLVDRLIVFRSPQSAGGDWGSDAAPAFSGINPVSMLATAEGAEMEQHGDDTSLSLLLRDPWTST